MPAEITSEAVSGKPGILVALRVGMEPSWSTFVVQANEALYHQHQVAGNTLLHLLNSGTESPNQKPVLPISLDQKTPVSAAELLKDNVASGIGGGEDCGGPTVTVVNNVPKSKTAFICGYCSKTFRDSYHLRRHESCHTGIKLISRTKKTQTATTMVPLKSPGHCENSGNPSFITAVAGILTTATTSTCTGTSIMTSTHHQQQYMKKKPPKPVKKNHGCDMCGKAFRDVYHLNRHKLSHSDEKPFECPICRQRFKRKDRMTYHALSHDGGVHKPYICTVCGKGFSRPDHLSCHVKHVHSSERPFKCQITACTSAFATKDRLRSHMIRHEGKVTCTICGKMLSAAYITSHLKTHGRPTFTNPCNNKGELTVGELLNKSFQVLIDYSQKDTSNVDNHSTGSTPVTSCSASTVAVNHISTANGTVTIAATGTVDLQRSVNIPSTAHSNIAPPVTTPTRLNTAVRPMESMCYRSQVLPSSPPW